MNSYGRLFKVSIFGESHGHVTGILIDGCPPGIPINEADFTTDLNRRKSGAPGTTLRQEKDIPQIQTGTLNGYTTGAPILITFNNENVNSEDYSKYSKIPRPGHTDFVSMIKYHKFNDLTGGGHFSGRLTLGIVSAGVIAKKIIKPIELCAEVLSVGGNTNIAGTIVKVINDGDSTGGLIECNVNNLPVGLGEPFFDSVESLISHIIFSIPGIKGIEFGAGFNSANMYGSEYNDVIINIEGNTKTNNSGGINGGITNGNPIIFRVAVKPASSISKTQNSINFETGKSEDFEIHGRHDVCIALRMPPIIEAAAAITFADMILVNKGIFL